MQKSKYLQIVMAAIHWLVRCRLYLAAMYAAVSILLHILVIYLVHKPGFGLVAAVLLSCAEFPTFFIFEPITTSFLIAGSVVHIVTQSVFTIPLNTLIIVLLLKGIGRIFKLEIK